MLGAMMKQELLISSLIEHAGKYHADTEIVSRETNGDLHTTNWGETAIEARKLASSLSKMGLDQGDRVATIAWNNHRHLKIWFALSGSGLVCHTLNPRLFPEQLIFIINDAGNKAIFFDKTFMPLIVGTREHLKAVEHFIYMGPHDEEVAAAVPGAIFFDDLMGGGDGDYQWPQLPEDTPCSLCYTSGTTGHPKGVLYTNRSTMLHSFAISLPDALSLSASEIILPVVPMFHANAWGIPYCAAMTGAKLVMPGPGLDGDSLLGLIDSQKVTLALGVPTIWMMLLDAAEKSGSKMETLRRNVIGGSAAAPSMIATFRDKYDCDTIHAWGMTETSPLGTANMPKAKHADLAPDARAALRLGQGRPPFGIDLRIVDENGVALPHDGVAEGALQVRGHWVVDTYFGMTETAMTDDGWFDTGDVSTIDADGYMVIRDRTKDIIKSGGEWISSVDLEGIAVAHPGIAMAAAIGAKHPKWDERPMIVAVKADGANPTEEEVIALFADKVAKWQIPDAVVFTDAIPLNGTGKMLKNKLREQFGDTLIERGV
ncbi:fatty-acyl-CoA synthase [Aliiroseovarius halocynthiae]|uniref:3-methylmercaptopropionyl-CoA ligase n=1 Tax=Aliiroseovarius halocynthiae TaxID=985055 RepID=A0A545SWP6_9RHOB|nr:long-chain-fatty-acid--CoA ligase [Aliiroseovarius halocynthiae]TQV69381.1 long-chain-fatty-acid--CoA ligase [Aliiroseovarius halocynthiae]SMR72770.1 fatty-acyl-CoA synthase [Aliiroseovarius halocynthiae]